MPNPLPLAAAVLLGAALLGVTTSPVAAATQAQAQCGAFVVTGDPRSAEGATWTYRATDQGVAYVMEGVLFVPSGTGPFPAVVLSHGKGGTPRAYSSRIARTMVTWGLVGIGPMYTHAPDAEDQGNMPNGPDGASPANVLRAHKARDLLSCVAGADLTRVAAHGHSMGAFVTGQLLGTYPTAYRAASHTAGGVSSTGAATKPTAAQQIATPYQLHHGDHDQVVPLAMDQALNRILTDNGVPHQLRIYPGYDHQMIAYDATMLARVRVWYETHGVL